MDQTNKLRVGPKDFFLWAGAMVAFYVGVVSFITLVFEYIDTAFPDVLSYNYDPYSGAIRFAIASLIVLLPLYLLLMRLIRADIATVPEKKDLWVRRWALVLTVFVAGATIAVDLIVLINKYLGGDITTAFGLKVVVVLLVATAGLLHFLADLRGYWIVHPRRVQAVGAGVGALIVATIASGFFIIGSPTQIRLYRFDDEKVTDLMNIQSQVVEYWRTKESLPQSLAEMSDPISGFTVPVDAQTGAQYEYVATGRYSFRLCATFNAETQPNSPSAYSEQYASKISFADGSGIENDRWYHDVGRVCYERTIDPERYPPYSKQKTQLVEPPVPAPIQ